MNTSRPMTPSRPIRAPRRIWAWCHTVVAWICADGSITGMRLQAVSLPMTGSGSISGFVEVAIRVASDDEGVGPRDQALAAAEVGSVAVTTAIGGKSFASAETDASSPIGALDATEWNS